MNKTREIASEFKFLYFDAKEQLDDNLVFIKDVDNRYIEELTFNRRLFVSDFSDADCNKHDALSIIKKQKVVFCFEASYCNDCLKKYISKIKNAASTQGLDVLLLVNAEDVQGSKLSINTFDLPIYFICQPSLFPKDRKPLFFCLDTDMKISNSYIPDLDNIDFIETYLKLNANVH